jgi:hypothetical protein
MKMDRIKSPSNVRPLGQLVETLGRLSPIFVNFDPDGIWKVLSSISIKRHPQLT